MQLHTEKVLVNITGRFFGLNRHAFFQREVTGVKLYFDGLDALRAELQIVRTETLGLDQHELKIGQAVFCLKILENFADVYGLLISTCCIGLETAAEETECLSIDKGLTPALDNVQKGFKIVLDSPQQVFAKVSGKGVKAASVFHSGFRRPVRLRCCLAASDVSSDVSMFLMYVRISAPFSNFSGGSSSAMPPWDRGCLVNTVARGFLRAGFFRHLFRI